MTTQVDNAPGTLLRDGVKEDKEFVTIVDIDGEIWVYSLTCRRSDLWRWFWQDLQLDIDDLYPTRYFALGEIGASGNLEVSGNDEDLKDLVPQVFAVPDREEMFQVFLPFDDETTDSVMR